jgi:hypothetical protein
MSSFWDSAGGISIIVVVCAFTVVFLWFLKKQWDSYKQRQKNLQIFKLLPEEEVVKTNNNELTDLFKQESEELAKFDKKFVNNEEFRCTTLERNKVGSLQIEADYDTTITQWNSYVLNKGLKMNPQGTNQYKFDLPRNDDGTVKIPEEFEKYINMNFGRDFKTNIFAFNNQVQLYYSFEAHISVEKPNTYYHNDPDNKPEKHYPLIAKFRMDIRTDRNNDNKINIDAWFQSCSTTSIVKEGLARQITFVDFEDTITLSNPLMSEGQSFDEEPKNESQEDIQPERENSMVSRILQFGASVAKKVGSLANSAADKVGISSERAYIIDEFTKDKIQKLLQNIFCSQQAKDCQFQDEKIAVDQTTPDYCWNRKNFQVTNNEQGVPLDQRSIDLMNDVELRLAHQNNTPIIMQTQFIQDIDDFILKYQYYWFSGETDLTSDKINTGLTNNTATADSFKNPYEIVNREELVSIVENNSTIGNGLNNSTIGNGLNNSTIGNGLNNSTEGVDQSANEQNKSYKYHLVPKQTFLTQNVEKIVQPSGATIKLVEGESTDNSNETKGWIRCHYEISYIIKGATTRYHESWNRCNQNVIILYLIISTALTTNAAKIMVFKNKGTNGYTIRYQHNIGPVNFVGLRTVNNIVSKFII